MSNNFESLMQAVAKFSTKAPGRIITGARAKELSVERISTGLVNLDRVLGGGWAKTKIHHVYAEKSSGKSSLMLQSIGALHKSDPYATVVVINCEGFFSGSAIEYGQLGFGIDPERLIIINSPFPEESFVLSEKHLLSRSVDLLIVDSISGIMSTAEQDKSFNDSAKMSDLANFVQRLMKKLVAALSPVYDKATQEIAENKCAVILLNQLRTAGIGKRVAFQSPTGGKSIPFFSDVEISLFHSHSDLIQYPEDASKVKALGNTLEGKEYSKQSYLGKSITITVEKNRLHHSQHESVVEDLYYRPVTIPLPNGFTGQGFDEVKSLVNLAMELCIIQSSGSWFSMDGENIAQGADKMMSNIRASDEIINYLTQRTKEELGKISQDKKDRITDVESQFLKEEKTDDENPPQHKVRQAKQPPKKVSKGGNKPSKKAKDGAS